MTIGQQLREAREAQGMSIGDVSRKTYIQPKFLQAIEEENVTSIPNPQRRFFVRDYARTVGVDAEALLAQLPDTPPPTPVAIAPESRTPIRFDSADTERRSTFPKFKPMAFGEQRRRSTNMVNWVIAAALLLLIGVGGYLAWSGGLFGGGTEPAAQAVQPPQPSNEDSPAQIINAPDSPAAAPASESSSWQPGDSMTLVGRATARVWFDVVSDGQRSSTGTLDSGVVKTWRAMKTFKVSLGNAGGLTLTLNDRNIGTLGPLRTAVRNQVIDSAGVRRPGGVRPTVAATTTAATPPTAKPATTRPTAATPRQTAPATTPTNRPTSTTQPNRATQSATNRTTTPSRPAASPETTQSNRTRTQSQQSTASPRRQPARRTPTVRPIETTEPRRVPRDPNANP